MTSARITYCETQRVLKFYTSPKILYLPKTDFWLRPWFFRCRFAVPVSRCRFRISLPLLLLLGIFLHGTEFSYLVFAEQRNFTTAERRNGNGIVETGH